MTGADARVALVTGGAGGLGIAIAVCHFALGGIYLETEPKEILLCFNIIQKVVSVGSKAQTFEYQGIVSRSNENLSKHRQQNSNIINLIRLGIYKKFINHHLHHRNHRHLRLLHNLLHSLHHRRLRILQHILRRHHRKNLLLHHHRMSRLHRHHTCPIQRSYTPGCTGMHPG